MQNEQEIMKFRLTPIALTLTVAFPAWAQTTSDNAAQSDASLPAVTVTATEESPSLPKAYAGGQVAKGARLGALGNQDVMDTPCNVTSYTSELIENQGAKTIGEVLSNDPSVRNTTSSGHAYENFRIRGFDVNQNDLAIDGLFGLAPVGHTPVEMFERVEVLKGPSAMYSGMAPSGAVGGVINLVPKRAGDEPLNRVTVGYETQSQLSTSLDVGRRFGEDKELGLRVNGSFSDGNAEKNGQKKTRNFVSTALDYRGKALKASLDAYHSKEEFKGGTPSMFWFTSANIPSAPDPRINQFPGASGQLTSDAVIAKAEYEIRSNLAAFVGLGVLNNDYSGFINGTHVRSTNASGTSTATITSNQLGWGKNVTSEAGLRGRVSTGEVLHEMTLQLSQLEQTAGSASNSSTTYTTSIYDPVYRAMPALPAYAPKTSESTLSSVALVDTLTMWSDKLRLTLGLRNQTVKTTNFTASGAVSGTPYDKSVVTPAVGVVVKPWGPDVSLYANYVQGLSKGDTVTNTAATNYNYTFAPYKTEQKEVGVKWQAGTFANTVGMFEINKPTLMYTGSSTSPTYTDGAEKRVRGLEWNTFGELTRTLRVLGGAAYTEGVLTKTQNGQYDGNTAVGAPRWQGNIGTDWDTPWVSGLSLNARVQATSSQYLDSANTMEIPGWAVLDVGARYTTKLEGRKIVYRLNIDNLFDRWYYSGAFSDSTPIATLGTGRIISVSASLDF
jgi:iron complex outermembrane recepter protein